MWTIVIIVMLRKVLYIVKASLMIDNVDGKVHDDAEWYANVCMITMVVVEMEIT